MTAAAMDFKIGMIAKRGISEFEDITPLMEPLACCLRSSCLSTHCSSCFRLLDEDDNMSSPRSNGFLTYCSSQCYDADQPIFSKSGELELFNHLKDNPDVWPSEDDILFRDVSFLRLALRFLLFLPDDLPTFPNSFPFRFPRIFGLSSNNPLQFVHVPRGAIILAMARSVRDNTKFRGGEYASLEMNALSLVITNALRVSLGNDTKPVGLALYDLRVSWINHSCSPNSYVRFVDAFQAQAHPHHDIELAIEYSLSAHSRCPDSKLAPEYPFSDSARSLNLLKGVSAPHTVSQLPHRGASYGPRAAVQSIHALREGEEVTITYIDISQPVVIRRNKLIRDYHFICCCRRCRGLDVSKGEDDRLLPVPMLQVMQCFMLRDYQFLCRCRRCVGLDSEWEDDDRGRCLAENLVLSILQNVELDDQDIVPEGPSALQKGKTPMSPKSGKNKKSLMRSVSSITRRAVDAFF